jgi:hypothetical protein
MIYESERIYNGIEVRVFASEFEGDESVGISYGPTCVWAMIGGETYNLTEEQETEIATAATAWALEPMDDDYF